MSAAVQGCEAQNQSRLERQLQQRATSPPQQLHSPPVVTVKRYETDVGVFVSKRQSPERANEEELEAEEHAAAILKRACGGPCPLLSTPAAVERTPDGAAHYVYVFAGRCVAFERAESWSKLGAAKLEQLAKTMAVCLLKAVAIYQALPENVGGSHAHRDIKLENICVRFVEGAGLLFVLIDHGGFCPTSGLAKFTHHYDIRYLDNSQASRTAAGCFAIDCTEALAVNTHLPTTDLRQVGLALVELYRGLPKQLDACNYNMDEPGQQEAFLDWVYDWPWDKWLAREVAGGRMSAAMADFLLRIIHQDWDCRTRSAAELLQHPWLAGEVAAVDATIAAAAPTWAAEHAALHAMLAPSTAAASSQQDASHLNSDTVWGSSSNSSNSSSLCDVRMQAAATAAPEAPTAAACSSSEQDALAGAPDATCCIVHVAAAGAEPKGSSSGKVCGPASQQHQHEVEQPLPGAAAALGCFPWLAAGSRGSTSGSDGCRRLAQKCAKALKKKASRATCQVAKAFKACRAVFV